MINCKIAIADGSQDGQNCESIKCCATCDNKTTCGSVCLELHFFHKEKSILENCNAAIDTESKS